MQLVILELQSAVLGKLALVISRFRTDQFSRSFLPAAVRLWNLQQSNVLSDGTLSSIKSTVKYCLLRAELDFLSLFQSFFLLYSQLGIMVQRPFWFIGAFLFLVLWVRYFNNENNNKFKYVLIELVRKC